MSAANPVRSLPLDVARKIAAGEVIDRPCAIVRELMDNAIDACPAAINVEITGGGIDSVRVQDDGVGMTRSDMAACARPHATSKIHHDSDLLNITTMGFRGEALASIAAVASLTITSGGYRMKASVTEDHVITPAAPITGTSVTAEGLFQNFPARRHFLKKPQAEGTMCRCTFIEKAMSRPDIRFTFATGGVRVLTLSACDSSTALRDRFVDLAVPGSSPKLFHEVTGKASNDDWSFTAVLGDSALWHPTRREIYIYINGRRIQEYQLVQAIEYGAMGFFPNGTFPVAALFVTMKPSLVDFNVHPAKKEARFQDLAPLHHGVSTAVREFYTGSTVAARCDLGHPLSSRDTFSRSSATPVAITEQPSSVLLERNGSMESIRPDGLLTNHDNKMQCIEPAEMYRNGQNRNDSGSGESSVAPYRAPAAHTASSSLPPSQLRFLGVALGVFLVVEKGGTLYLIDQHAAHERLLYDQMMTGSDRQPLLVPYVLVTESDGDDEYMRGISNALTAAGFHTKCVAYGRWEIWSTPALWRGGEEDLRHAVLDCRVDARELIRKVAAASACKDAVKDGTYLDDISAQRLAEAALQLPDPHCPHGRPIWCAFSREELFALVRRT